MVETDAAIRTRPTLIEERFRARSSSSRDVVMTEMMLAKGSLDPLAIAGALPRLVEALPMLSARYQASSPWGLTPDIVVSGRYRSEDSLQVHPAGTSMDWLHRELTEIHGRVEDNKLWSVHFVPGEDHDYLLVAIHHLIVDAPSMAQVLFTLMHLIDGGTVPKLDDPRAHVEERHQVMRAALDYRPRKRLFGAGEVVRFPERHKGAGLGSLGNIAPDIQVIRRNARDAGVTFHEYTLAAAAIATARWLEDVAGVDVAARKLVVRFPVNLRPAANPAMGFGPAVGHADVVTAPPGRAFEDVLGQVRQSLAQQTDVLRTDGQRRFAVNPLAPMLWAVPAAARPVLLSLASDGEPTIWLSNTGAFTDGISQRAARVRAGILRRASSAPLILMFGAGDRLQITGSLPATVASPEESHQFFKVFAGVLEGGA